MMTFLLVVLQVIGVVLLVDFVSGVLHWLEDSYGREDTPLIGKYVVKPNIVHHFHPREMTKGSFRDRNLVTGMICAVIFLGAWLLAGPTWQAGLFCVLGAFSNEFHCWAHRSPGENGRIITALHRLHILQTPKHHSVHHTNPKNRAYCVITNYVNPVLDRIEFWRRMEGMIATVFGVHPRPDLSVQTR